MVRNQPSTQNLPPDMNQSVPAFQLRGADDYTKSLMNRIATGQATDAERLLFDERVRNMQNKAKMGSHSNALASRPMVCAQTDEPLARAEHPYERIDCKKKSETDEANKEKLRDDELAGKQGLEHGQEVAPTEDDLEQMKSQLRAIFYPNQDTSATFPSIVAAPYGGTDSKADGTSASGFAPAATELPKLPQKPIDKRKNTKPPKKGKKVSIPIEGSINHNGQESETAEEEIAPLHTKCDLFSLLGEDLESLKMADKPGKKNKKKKEKQNKPVTLVETIDPPHATREAASVYTQPFCDFLTNNPTVFHAVDSQKKQLLDLGWKELDERKKWDLAPGGKYFVERNGSSMIAFTVGEKYKPGNGCAIIAGHVDALTAKLKPISEVPNKAGYYQLGVAPYAGALNSTWWDRDLGIGGRVLVKEDDKIVTKLVKLDWPIARIPTLAPHFGAAAAGPFNKETQMVPIIGLECEETADTDFETTCALSDYVTDPVGGKFVSTQPLGLVKVIGDALGLSASTYGNIVNWELELFDIQPATLGGLNKEFLFAGRLDDKLCSWAAIQALISDHERGGTSSSSVIKMVGWFDNEEIGSQLRQGAKSNFLPLTIERAVGCLGQGKKGANLVGRTYANSFLISSDVTHAVNPNFLGAYLENHSPKLNVGLTVHADPNGNMTTDAVSAAILKRCVDSVGANLQVFQIRNDSRSGGTVGPMLSAMTGIRAIDAGLPQLSMHSIRATTGSLDPGLGVITYMGFLNRFEHVDKEFRN